MRNLLISGAAILALLAASAAKSAEDERELVQMPAMMQQHMLASMRDHLLTLGEILADVSAEKYDDAAKVAEERLGLSSFGLHDAARMAVFMPQPMQEAGTALHRAASRFAIVAKDVDVDRTYDAMKQLDSALNDMVSACNACHTGYRIR